MQGLDLIDRVPEELWMEVHNIVMEAMIKTIPKKKKCKKAKWLSEKALQIAEKRREVRGKGEKEEPCYSLELCIQMGISPFLLCLLVLFFSQLFLRPPQTAVLPLCISSSWGWS